jgi:hypothetical protein
MELGVVTAVTDRTIGIADLAAAVEQAGLESLSIQQPGFTACTQQVRGLYPSRHRVEDWYSQSLRTTGRSGMKITICGWSTNAAAAPSSTDLIRPA